MQKMQNSSWKILFLAWVIIFRKSGFACTVITVRAKPSNRDTEISQKVCIHLNSKNFRDLKFGLYIPCVAFDKFDVAILKILLFG